MAVNSRGPKSNLMLISNKVALSLLRIFGNVENRCYVNKIIGNTTDTVFSHSYFIAKGNILNLEVLIKNIIREKLISPKFPLLVFNKKAALLSSISLQ